MDTCRWIDDWVYKESNEWMDQDMETTDEIE